jgi:hypothetical protein
MAQANPADYPGIKPKKINGEILLFDLENDPTESTNVAGAYPEIVKEMTDKYNLFLNSLINTKRKK